MKRIFFSLFVASAVLLSSAVTCHEIDPDDPGEITFTYGAYFLNAGSEGKNDAELTQLNTMYGFVNGRAYSLSNDGATLGSGATDIYILEDKMFVTLSASKQIKVLNKFTCTDVGTVTVTSEEGVTLTPLYMTAYEGALIVSFEEGYLARIDPATLQPTVVQEIAGTPRQIAMANQKLYVAIYREGDADGHSVSMFNPVALHVMKTVEVLPRPTRLETDPASGNLYVISEGNSETAAALQVIDSKDEEVTLIPGVVRPTLISAGNKGAMLLYVQDGIDEHPGRFMIFNTDTQKLEGEFIQDGSLVQSPCMLSVDKNTNAVYIGCNPDSTFGIIHIYTSYGQYLSSFYTGAPNPCGAVFVTGN